MTFEVEREQFRLNDRKQERFIETFMTKLEGYFQKLEKQYDKTELLDHHLQLSFKDVVAALKKEMEDHMQHVLPKKDNNILPQHPQQLKKEEKGDEEFDDEVSLEEMDERLEELHSVDEDDVIAPFEEEVERSAPEKQG